jgi:hypothetical protein
LVRTTDAQGAVHLNVCAKTRPFQQNQFNVHVFDQSGRFPNRMAMLSLQTVQDMRRCKAGIHHLSCWLLLLFLLVRRQ